MAKHPVHARSDRTRANNAAFFKVSLIWTTAVTITCHSLIYTALNLEINA